MDLLATLVSKDYKVRLVFKDLKEYVENRVIKERLVFKVMREKSEQLENKVF